ncbi:hypothetical protein HDV00_001102 [Rhizophlyctis rosea]|nr:hypothetical protein HDV00_001102 [Rhizophlyctis rosea]
MANTPAKDGLRKRKTGSAAPAPATPQTQNSETKKSKKQQLAAPPSPSLTSPVTILLALFLAAIAFAVRTYRLSDPNEVVFDEIHFAEQGVRYLRREMVLDYHPPLGKLFYTLAAYLSHYKGGSDINIKYIGDSYDAIPYIAMRLVSATFGTLLVPVAYLTLRKGGLSHLSAALAGLLITFDNAIATQSRLILLDAPLMFFIALATLFWLIFRGHRDAPFSLGWWGSLIGVGVSLGCVTSIKWVGLFTVATVGLLTLHDLSRISKQSPRSFPLHVIARAIALIVIPIAIYISAFAVHFAMLEYRGPGDKHFPMEVREGLLGAVPTPPTIKHVYYGSKVHIRHEYSHGGFLTCAEPAADGSLVSTVNRTSDTAWLIKLTSTRGIPEGANVRLRYGDMVVLEHVKSRKLLTHDDSKKSVVTKGNDRATCTSHSKDHYTGNKIWMVSRTPTGANNNDHASLNAMEPFHLINAESNAVLYSTYDHRLPDETINARDSTDKVFHQEVSCANKTIVAANPFVSSYSTTFRIEINAPPSTIPEAEKAELVTYTPATLKEKVLAVYHATINLHHRLPKHHPSASTPLYWPLPIKTTRYWRRGYSAAIGKMNRGWRPPTAKQRGVSRQIPWSPIPGGEINLFPSWAVWSAGLVGLVVFDLLLALGGRVEYVDMVLKLGWIIHYIPFFFITTQRQLFVHHYLPSLYFSILLFACVLDKFTRRVPAIIRLLLVTALLGLVVYVFWTIMPYTYGYGVSQARCQQAIWRKFEGFDVECSRVALLGGKKNVNTGVGDEWWQGWDYFRGLVGGVRK